MREGVVLSNLLRKQFTGRFIAGILFCALSFAVYAAKNSKVTPPEPQQQQPLVLQVVEQVIPIDGKPQNVFTIIQPDKGTVGFMGERGQQFNVVVENKTPYWIALNWHGVGVPNNQDGVPYLTQQPIPPGGQYKYSFPLELSGTYWMHSHYRNQWQQLMAAPLVVLSPQENPKSEQQVVMLLQDYSADPKLTYDNLRERLREKLANVQVGTTPNTTQTTATQNTAANTELAMDSYLANYHTMSNPEIVKVSPGGVIRLRVINAAANTNFFVSTGQLNGKLVAVDGEPIAPIEGSRFQVGQGQRVDVELALPANEGAYPIIAQAENTSKIAGLMLATPQSYIPKYEGKASFIAGNLDYSQEFNIKPIWPLPPKKVDRVLKVDIDGNLVSYVWTMNGQFWPNVTPLLVKQNERVELDITNRAPIAIPIHLHGHVFQITEIDGKKLRGAMRDTVLVLPNSQVKVEFDADNPGVWLLRGYVPYQMNGVMMTLISYDGYPVPLFDRKDTGIPPAGQS